MEEWRDIPGYDGYQASSLGRVKSIDRTLNITMRGKNTVRRHRGRVLSPGRHSEAHPYQYYQLGRGVSVGGHILVALAFLGERPVGYVVAHIDGNPENNKPDNLYNATKKENQADRLKHGTTTSGEDHPSAKLTENDVANIRQMLKHGVLQKDIARKYGISQPSVSNIARETRWRK